VKGLPTIVFVYLILSIGIIPALLYENANAIVYFPPPLKQISDGIKPKNVICNEGLQIILKSNNNFPACVKPDSVEKLIKRDWGKIMSIQLISTKVSSITNFEECVSAGNPIVKPYPRQC